MQAAKIFDTLLEPTFVITQTKEVHYCNEPAALICDSSVRKVQRQHPKFDELFKFTEAVQHLDNLAEVVDSSGYQEVGFTTESGKTGKVQITMQPFTDVDGVKMWLVYFRDVTLEETLQKKYRGELEQKESYIQDLQKARDELKNYSENLEKMVEARTAEVMSLNQTMRALLDSLTQGFYLFDVEGQCLPVYSQSCLKVLECAPSEKKVWDLLKLSEKQVPGFKKWLTTLFGELLPFADLSPLGPQTFPHSEGKHIQLEYYPVRNADGKISAVVGVASDITNLILAQQEAEVERSQSKMILNLIRNKTQSSLFIREAKALTRDLATELAQASLNGDSLFRILHTLKGGSASFNIKTVADACHHAEGLLTTWKSESTNTKALEDLKKSCVEITHHFEEFLTSNTLVLGNAANSNERWIEVPVTKLFKFPNAHQFSEALSSQFVQEFLMVPAKEYFEHYEEVIQTVAAQESKQLVPHKIENGEMLVLPEIYESLFNTLVHAYRNAVDHGIETSDVREAAGKPAQGSILTRFTKDGATLQIEVIDDGGGINPAKIRERLTKKGIDCSNENDHQAIQHVFDSQFSTKEAVTSTSGRGVGMDAILDAAKKLGGTAEVFSEVGKGSRLVIRAPYLTSVRTEKLKAA